jgi:NitT/TauT family transport system ATP-binding protein
MPDAVIKIEHLRRSFARGEAEVVALADVNLEVEHGTFTTIVGPSGCGKSTMLNIIAGLLSPSSGTVYYKGQVVDGPRLELGYMTQKETLMPWREIVRNVEMPLELRGIEKPERRRRARELIETVGLEDFDRHYPHELSGGMLRRASLARLLCADPETLLMDEPFGALDAQLRLELQNELLSLWSGSGKTVMFVTHDIEEAIVLGDRAIVLGIPGRVIHDERIALPRPRDAAEIRFLPEFLEIHQRLWGALKEASQQKGATLA